MLMRFAHRPDVPPLRPPAQPLPRLPLELLQRARGLAAKWAHERSIVLVGDRPGSVVELELLEGGERPVARLDELEATPLRGVELVERIGYGLGLSQERERHRNHTGHREKRSENQGQRQRVAGTPSSRVLSTRRRCSRASGHRVMRDPRRKTSPAIQIRFTSGFTKTRKYTVPSGVDLLGDDEQVLAGQRDRCGSRPRSRPGPRSCTRSSRPRAFPDRGRHDSPRARRESRSRSRRCARPAFGTRADSHRPPWTARARASPRPRCRRRSIPPLRSPGARSRRERRTHRSGGGSARSRTRTHRATMSLRVPCVPSCRG